MCICVIPIRRTLRKTAVLAAVVCMMLYSPMHAVLFKMLMKFTCNKTNYRSTIMRCIQQGGRMPMTQLRSTYDTDLLLTSS
ncbi:hypothetical protein F4820DRAFT_146461 [Hypoxylon rubiginosum]|uniref:Uncharacterized protein n=1 Tax=Hypoxylon rubiginosum TaxID=110542 RepID=A0ACB9ZGW6_9PEZI|nr:hypothetical protein F4820DRAFT_146461 [Hypoxylon rubiginosum]